MIRYLVLFLLISASLISKAQHVRVGPKVGVQASRPSFDDQNYDQEYTSEYGLGFNAGGVINWKASDYFSLYTELVYSRVHKKLKGTDGYAVNRDHFNYLTAPILLRGSFPIGQAEVYLNAGPSVNYWLGGRGYLLHTELIELELYELDHRIAFGEQPAEANNGDDVLYITKPNRWQLGLDIGTGVMIPMGNRYLMVDARYSWGHTNMAKRDTEYINLFDYNDNLSFANHTASISVAYLIEFDLIKLTRKGKSKTIKGKGR